MNLLRKLYKGITYDSKRSLKIVTVVNVPLVAIYISYK